MVPTSAETGSADVAGVAAGVAVLGVVSLLVGVRSFRRLGLTPEGPEWLAAQEETAEAAKEADAAETES